MGPRCSGQLDGERKGSEVGLDHVPKPYVVWELEMGTGTRDSGLSNTVPAT